MKAKEQQIKAMLYQNMDRVEAEDTWRLVEQYVKDEAVRFHLHTMTEKDDPTIQKFYEGVYDQFNQQS